MLLALFLTLTAHAHDPYEITSVASLHSNRIELLIELEFPTALKLAGIEPQPPAPLISQLEAAQSQLRQLAGSFFDFTAGQHVVPPRQTNVVLATEDHIHFQLEFAPTAHRPLRFSARGLANVADSSYGTTLTVLDMVNQKVLGQTTLFANSPPADFPPRTSIAAVDDAESEPHNETTTTTDNPADTVAAPAIAPALPSPAAPLRASRLTFLLVIGCGAIAFIFLAARRSRN